jgi:hypothetical protein
LNTGVRRCEDILAILLANITIFIYAKHVESILPWRIP